MLRIVDTPLWTREWLGKFELRAACSSVLSCFNRMFLYS